MFGTPRINSCAIVQRSIEGFYTLRGRWVHPAKSDTDAQRDWEICKAEALSGKEHGEQFKETMADGVNLSGCMRSKGYEYMTDPTRR